jgi:hypothetical protein
LPANNFADIDQNPLGADEVLPSIWASLPSSSCYVEYGMTSIPAAPKKKAQKISLNEFLGDSGKCSAQTLQKRYWNVFAQR